MKKELKKAIINFIFDNDKEFQLHHAVTNKFRQYIYDSDGNYIIGGEDVSNFIDEALHLIIDL